jgi:hypothetical protein
MKSVKQSRSRIAADEQNLCQFSFADGRQCRMLRHQSHSSLCVFHAREEQQLLALDDIGEQFSSISGQFRTSTDINHVIGKLFKLVGTGRIPARRAETLAYLAQLLLYSQKDIRYETNLAHIGIGAWQQTVRAAFPPRPVPPAAPTQSASVQPSAASRKEALTLLERAASGDWVPPALLRYPPGHKTQG